MENAVIVSAVRSPVGKCRGIFASVEPYKMGAKIVKEAVKRAGISMDLIDEVIFGNLMGYDVNNMARVALKLAYR